MTHSQFSASASSRLLACPGSYARAIQINAATNNVRRASVYSAQGTLAHALSEACLHTGVDAAHFVGDTRTADGFSFEIDEEMAEAIQTYVDYIRGLKLMGYRVLLEVTVNPAHAWAGTHPPLPVDLYGTSDVVAYNPKTQDLKIVDLKFGAGVAVEAKRNPQLLYYATGALASHVLMRFAGTQPIRPFPVVKTVSAIIIQPRAFHPDGPIRWWDYTAQEVLDWARDTLYPGVAIAVADDGNTFTPGKHCRFCPVGPHCQALKDFTMNAATQAFMAAPAQNLPASAPAHAALPQATLSDAALGEILDKIEVIGPWLDAVKKLALERLEAGTPVPGWKLVPKRAQRKYVEDDPDSMLAVLDQAGVDPAVVREITLTALRSPAQAEKKLGKKVFDALISPHVVKVSSGNTIAPEVDPRSVAARRTAQEAFGIPAGQLTSNTP